MILKNLGKILENKRYLGIFAGLSVLFSIGSYYLTINKIVNLDNFIYVNGLRFSIAYFILSFLTATLLGLYASLFFYKYEKSSKIDYKNGTTGFFGGFLGALGTGCAGCSFSLFSGVASFLGLSLGLASLPFKGLELKALGVLFLAGTNFLGLRSLEKGVCKK